MLIPAECHNTGVRIDPSFYQMASLVVPTIARTSNLFLGSQHEKERRSKKKRKITLVLKDSTELSEEALDCVEGSDTLDNLLGGLLEAY